MCLGQEEDLFLFLYQSLVYEITTSQWLSAFFTLFNSVIEIECRSGVFTVRKLHAYRNTTIKSDTSFVSDLVFGVKSFTSLILSSVLLFKKIAGQSSSLFLVSAVDNR